jgi:hypothetical protein
MACYRVNFTFTPQETYYVSATKPNWLMLFREIIAVYCENHTEHTDTLCVGKMQGLVNIAVGDTCSDNCTLNG